jgi:NAD(P)-dependent dehydrogenase (short-subunit alcohol dehydrogenase family)
VGRRTYVVTGAASGMGSATKARLEDEGHRVIGIDLHSEEISADLASKDGRAAMIDAVGELTDSVDAVVACAGVAFTGASEETKRRIAWDSSEMAIRVNYFGAVATLEGLRPLLQRGRDPRAVVVCSIAAVYPGVPGALVDACLEADEDEAVAEARSYEPKLAYAASKRAIARWVRRAAPTPEWAGAGIPLNAIAPARIQTAMSSKIDPDNPNELPMPLHGAGRPEHAAALLAWLASPDNVLTTGQLIFLDGGWDTVTRGDDVW